MNLTEDSHLEEEMHGHKQKIMDLKEEEEKVDFWIEKMQEGLNDMANSAIYKSYAFVTYDDIKKLNQNNENKNDTLLAIRAPAGTTLEVPDPDHVNEYYKYLENLRKTTQINVWFND